MHHLPAPAPRGLRRQPIQHLLVLHAQQLGVEQLPDAEDHQHNAQNALTTMPGSNARRAQPAIAVLSGHENWAISRRTAKTRPCSSRGVCVCQMVCECEFITGIIAR